MNKKEQKKDELRLIPLSEDFMKNKKVYDTIYSYFQLHSFLDSQKRRYVYAGVVEYKKWTYSKIVEELGEENVCCYNTYVNALRMLLEPTKEELDDYMNETDEKRKEKLFQNLPIGFLIKGTTIGRDGVSTINCYFLKEKYERFKLIKKRTLEYLYLTSNKNIIKIYVYLLNCYSLKQSAVGDKQPYLFTKYELANAIGYTSKSIYDEIDENIKCLKKIGLIDYHIEKVFVSSTTITYYHSLDKVSLDIDY